MEIIKVKVYKLNELSDKAKEKAISDYQIIVDDSISYDWIIEDEVKKLKKLGYDNPKVLFSGFYGWGDGACFTANINILKWIENHGKTKELNLLYNNSDDCIMSISHDDEYYHSYSTNFEQGIVQNKPNEKFKNQMETMRTIIRKERITLGDEIYRRLKEHHSDDSNNEIIIDRIRGNKCKFLEDGNLFNYSQGILI